MIDNLRELSEVVTNVANRIVEVATGNTSTGQYYVDYDDVSDLISFEDYLQYADFIASELYGREEILELDHSDGEFGVNCGLAWCKNYAPLPEEDFAYGYLDVRPAPSMTHLADIGRQTVDHLVQKGPFANLYGENIGVTESDKDYVKAYLQTEAQTVTHAPMPMPNLPGGWPRYKDIQIQNQQRRQEGSRPILEWAFNIFGQDISAPSLREQYPQEFKTLKDSMKLPKHASDFARSGAFLYGEPVLVYTLELKNELAGPEYDPEFHAQTVMMSAHMKKALSHYNVNITYGIESGDASDQYCRPSDEILAFVPAEAESANIVQFEKDLSRTLSEMPFTQDSSWVAEQYAAAMSAISDYADQPFGRWLFEHPDTWHDAAILTCEQLGSRVGELHSGILSARKMGDDKRLEGMASHCSFTADGAKDYLEECIGFAESAVRMDFSYLIALYTEPHTAGRHEPDKRFTIPAGELKAMLPDLGFDADTSLENFLNSYTCDVAREAKALAEGREKKAKLTLDQQMKSAEGRRQDPEPKDKDRGKERGD